MLCFATSQGIGRAEFGAGLLSTPRLVFEEKKAMRASAPPLGNTGGGCTDSPFGAKL
jgi:hypothetical protein